MCTLIKSLAFFTLRTIALFKHTSWRQWIVCAETTLFLMRFNLRKIHVCTAEDLEKYVWLAVHYLISKLRTKFERYFALFESWTSADHLLCVDVRHVYVGSAPSHTRLWIMCDKVFPSCMLRANLSTRIDKSTSEQKLTNNSKYHKHNFRRVATLECQCRY